MDILVYQGGHIEKGETAEDALKRELFEEISVETLDFGLMGYLKTANKETPKDIEYHLRYWARVALLDETPDPDGKVVGRVIVSVDEVAQKINWGKRGRILVELAKNAYKERY